ncbi:MAG: glutamine amidotransferase [Methylovirgula sp.]
MKTAIAIRHVQFEDLGTLAPVLQSAGYSVTYADVDSGILAALDPQAADLVIVLGGPLGVYQTGEYPFLFDEIRLLEARLAANRPTLGICLGSQLIAAALGAKVAPAGHSEIGFSRLTLNVAGAESPLRHLADVDVLHWHGDTFAVPEGGTLLASTPLCAHQAFSRGPNILALQFHPEPGAAELERWLIGYAGDLAHAKLDPRAFRKAAAAHCPPLQRAAARVLAEWLGGLKP